MGGCCWAKRTGEFPDVGDAKDVLHFATFWYCDSFGGPFCHSTMQHTRSDNFIGSRRLFEMRLYQNRSDFEARVLPLPRLPLYNAYRDFVQSDKSTS